MSAVDPGTFISTMTTDPGSSFDHRANRVTSSSRAVGGRLTVVDDRLVFLPNAAEKLLRVTEWSAPLGDVVGADVAPINPLHLFAGGIRTRLAVHLRDGRTQLFVLRNPGECAEQLLAFCGGAGART